MKEEKENIEELKKINEDKDICPECGCIHEEDSLHELAVITANSLTREVFPKFWNDAKNQVKELSRKELAGEMFHAGAINMLYGYMKLMDELAKKEKK